MSLEENKKLARLYFEGTANGDGSVFDAIMSDDFIVHAIHGKYSVVINADADAKGPAAFKAWLPTWQATWPDGQVTLDEVVAEGDRVIVLWTFSGTQRAEFLGIPATNKRVTYSGFNVFRVADGKLAEAWDLMDRLGLWQQLGVLPETKEFLAKAKARFSTAP